ncbi:MAG: hypothetical protein OEZ06_01805 [Myxococcales bacterium]|nr:hypothetical protein [Myxococcales bacterium]
MTPGEALLDVPMGDIIERMGRAIAEAQQRLDQISVQSAVLLGETRLDLLNEAGEIVSRSLLELGFTPSFYHFSETTIEISVELSIKVEEGFDIGAQLSFQSGSSSGTGATGTSTTPVGATGPTGPAAPPTSTPTNIGGQPIAPLGQQILSTAQTAQRASMFGLTISADYHRRYEFDTSAASKVKTKMLAVPPPTVFMEALRQHFRLGADN